MLDPGSIMIEVKNISKIYSVEKKLIKAVNDISFTLMQGEIFGLVGESGSGKSTLGRMLSGLLSPTSGTILFEGKEMKGVMPTKIQMIFQDPSASLNPRMTIGEIIEEPLKIHGRSKPTVLQLLDLVGLPSNAKGRFPHEFSGGQKQRIGIARALALQPRFLICDEPISQLDVSIQAQIVNLLLQLHKELGLTYLFIAHDLAMVYYFATCVAVMHQGSFVECKPTEQLYKEPEHPYTKLLLSTIHER